MTSKITAWGAMVLIVAIIVLCALLHLPWWYYLAVFFVFMAAFSHLCGLYLRKFNPYVANTLATCAFVCVILGVVAFVVIYFVSGFEFGL